MKTILNLLIIISIGAGISSHAQSDKKYISELSPKGIDSITTTFEVNDSDYMMLRHPLKRLDFNLSFEAIRQTLNDDEIVIESFLHETAEGEKIYAAYTFRSNYDTPHIYELFSEDELTHEMGKGDAMFTATKVASMLLESLTNELTGVKKVFFIPAGKLHLFAIEYCNVENGTMLAEKYQFYRLTSSAVIANRKSKQEQYHSYAIFGGIDYDLFPDFEECYEGPPQKCQSGYLQDSYYAAIETNTFLSNKGLDGHLYANEAATESSFKALSDKNIQLLLIETHGVNKPGFDDTVTPNSLMLAGSSYILEGGIVPQGYNDGLLTIDEISELNLSSIDLAAISACRSAISNLDRNGVNGLIRAFKKAGVNSLVMTTDDVVDYVAGEVWKSFFRNIINGMNKRESLLNAIKNIRTIDNGFYSSPEYWAPFILIDGLD